MKVFLYVITALNTGKKTFGGWIFLQIPLQRCFFAVRAIVNCEIYVYAHSESISLQLASSGGVGRGKASY